MNEEKKKKDPRGRKKTNDPKVHIQLYVHKSVIKRLKGLNAVKALCYNTIFDTDAELNHLKSLK